MPDDRPEYCPHCGERVSTSGPFCSSCGSELPAVDSAGDWGTADGSPPVETKPSSSDTETEAGHDPPRRQQPETVDSGSSLGWKLGRGFLLLVFIVLAVLIGGSFLAGFLQGADVTEKSQFEKFEANVTDDVDVKAIGAEERRWVAEIYSDRGDFPAINEDVTAVATAYADHVPDDEDHRRLDIIVYGAADRRVTELLITAETARAYRDGQMTREAFSERIVEKIVTGAAP